MKSRHALSVAVVVLGAVIFFVDRIGSGGFLPSSAPRLAVLPTATSTSLSIPTIAPLSTSGARPSVTAAANPSLPSSTTAIAVPTIQLTDARGDSQPRDITSVTASRTEAASMDDLWNDLAGFSNKSNQEREQYVAERLFPKAGLADLSKQSVPYIGSFGSEYGNWDGLSNVVAVRKGSLPTSSRKLIVLGAHFDKVTYPRRSASTGRSDGILDNASGVNLIAKIVQAMPTPLNDIEVVAFASEEPEPYFLGSRIYFGKSADRPRMLFFANFDCLGIGNLALISQAEDPSLSNLAVRVAANEGTPLVWRAASGDVASDHLIAQYFGVKTLYFTTDGYDWHNTHVPEDNLSAVNKEAYYRHYLISLKIVAYLDAYLAEASSRP